MNTRLTITAHEDLPFTFDIVGGYNEVRANPVRGWQHLPISGRSSAVDRMAFNASREILAVVLRGERAVYLYSVSSYTVMKLLSRGSLGEGYNSYIRGSKLSASYGPSDIVRQPRLMQDITLGRTLG